MAINFAKARTLCSASELELVEGARPKRLTQWSEKQLRDRVTRARRLRDKGRDVATRQRRQTQQTQGARTTSANARSRQKSELFQQVLSAYESRLAAVGGSGASAGKGADDEPRKTPKRLRSLVNRAERAIVREAAREKRRLLNEERTASAAGKASSGRAKAATSAAAASKGAKAKKKAAAKAAPQARKKKSAAASTLAAIQARPAKKKKRSAKKAAAASQRAGAKAAGSTGIARKKKAAGPKAAGLSVRSLLERPLVSPVQQQAVTAAKKARIEKGGLTSRTRGHVSARGRRAQTRRDSRR